MDALLLDIPHNATSYEMQRILQNSFGRAMGRVEVKQSGNCKSRQWIVEWISMGGDKSSFEVAASTNDTLSGLNATVAIETIQDGGVVIGPLTGEFLQTAELSPQV